jgi:molybdate transport system substrate-binding protein
LERSATKTPRSAQLTLFVPPLLTALLVVASLGALCAPGYIAAPADLRVFGAASLKDAIDDANERYRLVAGRKVVASYGGSDTMAKQIENGAPADIFISADIDWMALARNGVIKPETRLNFLRNKLVLIASAGRATTLAAGHF